MLAYLSHLKVVPEVQEETLKGAEKILLENDI